MAARVIGLDVGTNAVRAVELEVGNRPVIRRMGQVGLSAGAVVDGEVIDVAEVSAALRRLWTEVGFKSRHVRVGMSSARVIVRTIEMPHLSKAELMSTIRLQLDDYVPIPAEDTIFDIRSMDGPEPTSEIQHLLLVATHEDAVQPLVMALRDANLKVAGVDVIPPALALALTHPESVQDDRVDIILSIGAGTVVIVAARGGESLFARTLTNVGGRRITEGIAGQLGFDSLAAERSKRLVGDERQSSVATIRAASPSVDDMIGEVRASLEFYAEQPASRPLRRLLLTGGGSLLPGLAAALHDQLGLDVVTADPFAVVDIGDRTGFEPCDLPYLAPYMAAAVGVALRATRPKERRIDLTPVAARRTHALSTRRLLAGVGAVVLVGAGGAFYLNGRSAVADEQSNVASARAQLADLQAQIDKRLVIADPSATVGEATPSAIAASVARTDIDWIAVEGAVKAGSTPLGVTISSFQGMLDPAAADSTPVAAADPTAAATTPSPLGTLTLMATAPGLLAVADWLDSIAADPRFAEPWASGLTIVTAADGSSVVQFSMTMVLTDKNLVDRTAPAGVPG